MAQNNTPGVSPHTGPCRVVLPAQAFSDELGLTRTDIKVLAAYCGCADWQTGWAYPKAQTLAAQLGMTAKTFSKYTTRLKAAGLLFRGRRHPHGGFWWWIDYSGRSRPLEGDLESPPGGDFFTSPSLDLTDGVPDGTREGEAMSEWDREPDACNDGLDPDHRSTKKPKAAPKQPVLMKEPATLTPTALAIRFRNQASIIQFGLPAPPIDPLRGAFGKWHRETGVELKEIAEAIRLFCREEADRLDCPMSAYFIKHGFEWIDRAKQEIYERELPGRIKKYREENEARLARIAANDPGLRRYRAARFPAGPVREKAEACGF